MEKLNAIIEYMIGGSGDTEVEDFNVIADLESDDSIRKACIDSYKECTGIDIKDLEILYVREGWGIGDYERRS